MSFVIQILVDFLIDCVKFSVLRIIKELQQQHGLRHGDFQRYRGYCTRRVKRLRKALNIPQGDKRHFKKREVNVTHLESKNSNEKFIHIPLMLAERAWAYAMQVSLVKRINSERNFFINQIPAPSRSKQRAKEEVPSDLKNEESLFLRKSTAVVNQQ